MLRTPPPSCPSPAAPLPVCHTDVYGDEDYLNPYLHPVICGTEAVDTWCRTLEAHRQRPTLPSLTGLIQHHTSTTVPRLTQPLLIHLCCGCQRACTSSTSRDTVIARHAGELTQPGTSLPAQLPEALLLPCCAPCCYHRGAQVTESSCPEPRNIPSPMLGLVGRRQPQPDDDPEAAALRAEVCGARVHIARDSIARQCTPVTAGLASPSQ